MMSGLQIINRTLFYLIYIF